jgi:hypothetical protein
MTLASWRSLSLVALLLLSAAGCQPRREPEVASSAGEPNYAATYPVALQAVVAGFDDHRREASKLDTGFSSYGDQLKDVSKPQVLQIIERADEAGRSSAYVERSRQLEQVSTFFETEKDDINKKVAGSAQYVAKQKGCNVDIYGTVTHSLKESIDKQIEKEMRERNEAQQIIERYRVSLGKPNTAALEKQADEISRASYLVHIELVERKVRLQAMLTEADRVRQTADGYIQKERAFQAEAGRTDPEKKAAEDRIAAMTQSKAALDGAVNQAKAAAPDMDSKIRASQKEYADALEALKARWRK